GRLRQARPGSPGARRACLLAPAHARGVRVLVPRGLHPPPRGMAVLRVPPARGALPRQALAQRARTGLCGGGGPPAGRGPADRHPARRGQGRRALVGLVRDEDRRGVDAGCRRRDLRAPGGLAAGLRPARAGPPRRTARSGPAGRRVPGPPRRGSGPRARPGPPPGPHRLPATVTPRRAKRVEESALKAGLIPVAIGAPGGTSVPAWADPEALAVAQAAPRGRHRAVLLSPFDSLVWDRKRTLRMFGFEHS